MNGTIPVHHGFKQITASNWQKPDMPCYFPDLTEPLWMEANLKPQLGANVPLEIAALFEVARGALIYGWCFYPLMTLGSEQCLRVLETGVRMCCKKNGLKVSKDFKNNIATLKKAGIIPDAEEMRWDFTRKLRNSASHPKLQTIIPPGMALGKLQTTAEMLNKLFPNSTAA